MSYKGSSICMKVIAFIVFLLLLQPAFSQQNFSDLDAELQQKQKLLGKEFVVMIWKKADTLVYKKNLGDFNSKTQAPIGSASQWLTAALAMTFVEEGKISLDDKITRWLPEFEKYGKNYITIRHCLSHFTGIKSDPNFSLFAKSHKYTTLEEEVNSYAALDIQNNPGEVFRYSNLGPNIVGRVLEIISKKKFDILARQRLFQPLMMRRTTFTDMEGGPLSPASGARATGDDYMQFLRMLLDKGMFQGRKILSEESVNELLKIQTKPELIKYAPKNAQGFSYASGAWVLQEKDGAATVVSGAGLFGTWPIVDYCHGYAYLFLTKELFDDDKTELQMGIKKIIDEQFKAIAINHYCTSFFTNTTLFLSAL